MEEKEFYTVKEFAQKMQIARRTVYDWLAQKKIKYFKIGRVIRIPKEAIDINILQNQRKEIKDECVTKN